MNGSMCRLEQIRINCKDNFWCDSKLLKLHVKSNA